MTRSAVAVFLYNRPEYSAALIKAIERANPSRLYLIFDAPNPDVAGDFERCREAYQPWNARLSWAILSRTHLEVAETHMGCRKRVATGLDWVFERERDAIILEDDCIPNASFFEFCDAALERYRHDRSVMHVNGCNFGFPCGPSSVYWARYAHVWGWATWRRAWRFYDEQARFWRFDASRKLLVEHFACGHSLVERHWQGRANDVALHNFDTWDTQWQLAIWQRDGMVVGPACDLVSNVGTGPKATHTKPVSPLFHRPTCELAQPFVWDGAPVSTVYDRWFERTHLLPMLGKARNAIG
jgi:hypothetical protein